MLKHILVGVLVFVETFLIVNAPVVVNEASKWAAAEAFGIRCKTFNLGSGSGGIKLGELGQTEVWLRSIPIGAWVEMPLWLKDKGRSLAELTTPEKVVVLAAGICVNLITGIALLVYVRKRKVSRPAARGLIDILDQPKLSGFWGVVQMAGVSSLGMGLGTISIFFLILVDASRL
jgi:membrane-associated protease RseP (regulator of RpoE activity)